MLKPSRNAPIVIVVDTVIIPTALAVLRSALNAPQARRRRLKACRNVILAKRVFTAAKVVSPRATHALLDSFRRMKIDDDVMHAALKPTASWAVPIVLHASSERFSQQGLINVFSA